MMIHQDRSTHEWVSGQKWDLISTMDDATNEHYSMFFCDEEGTASSFEGVQETIAAASTRIVAATTGIPLKQVAR